MKHRSFFRTLMVLMMATALLVGTASISFAAVSAKSITYKGSGTVVVSYRSKVSYDDVSVSVKDNAGKSYNTSIKKKSDSSITFLIKSYKTGMTYNVSVSGVSGGTVSGSFKIYSKSKAISIAKANAKKLSKIKTFKNVKGKSSTYRGLSVWKVTFQANDRSYTYMVAQQTGKIIYSTFS